MPQPHALSDGVNYACLASNGVDLVFLMGGSQQSTGGSILNAFNVYNVSENSWSVAANMPIALMDHMCTYVKSTARLMVIGGRTYSENASDLWYRTVSDVTYVESENEMSSDYEWHVMDSGISAARCCGRALSVMNGDGTNEYVFVIGGYEGENRINYRRIDAYDVNRKVWWDYDGLNIARRNFVAVAVPDEALNSTRMWIFGGYEVNSIEVSEANTLKSVAPSDSPTSAPTPCMAVCSVVLPIHMYIYFGIVYSMDVWLYGCMAVWNLDM